MSVLSQIVSMKLATGWTTYHRGNCVYIIHQCYRSRAKHLDLLYAHQLLPLSLAYISCEKDAIYFVPRGSFDMFGDTKQYKLLAGDPQLFKKLNSLITKSLARYEFDRDDNYGTS